ncbi:MAG: hypothetical protein ACTSUK_04445, partial [Promethearchaeota archaeon]
MADRVSELISHPIISRELLELKSGIDVKLEEENLIQSLQMDLHSRKNIIFYASTPRSSLGLSLQAALPVAIQNHQQLVCVLHSSIQKSEILEIFTHIYDHSFPRLQIGDFRGINQLFSTNQLNYASILSSSTSSSPSASSVPPLCQADSSSDGHNINSFFKLQGGLEELWNLENNSSYFQYTSLPIIKDFYQNNGTHWPLKSFLSELIPHFHVIFVSYSDVFTFHPYKPGFFHEFVSIDQSLLIFEDCHYLPQFLLNKYSIEISVKEIAEIQEYLMKLFKSNQNNSHYRFFSKFFKRFLKYIENYRNYSQYTQNDNKSKKIHQTEQNSQIQDGNHNKKEYPFSPLEFLHNLCQAHKCSFDRLTKVIQQNFDKLFLDSASEQQNFNNTIIKLYNYFTAVIYQHTNHSLPYTFTSEFTGEITTLFMTLLDIRHFTDPIFENAAATFSVSSCIDIRSYLAITGLGSLARGFIIRHLAPVDISNHAKVWGDLSINPHANFNSPVIAAKYASKLVQHARIFKRATVVFFGNTSIFQGVLAAEIKNRLEQIGYIVKSLANSSDTITQSWLSQLHEKQNEKTPLFLLLDINKIPLELIQPLLPYFDIFSFISFPAEKATYRVLKRNKYLARKYDPVIAQIYSRNNNFY